MLLLFLDLQATAKSNALRVIDITTPQRTTTNASAHNSNHFLTFTQTNHVQEIRYNITAFGKVIHFILKPERRFIGPAFTVEHCSGNHSESIPSGADLSHCFYRGRVYNDSASSAVFDLCSGMVSLRTLKSTFDTTSKRLLVF